MDQTRQPIGPLRVEPRQWDHGGSMCITHPERGILAVIEPINVDDEPGMDEAQHEPWDAAYAQLFAAAPGMRDALTKALDVLTDERIGQWSYMEGSQIYSDFAAAAAVIRAALAKAETIDPMFLTYPLPQPKDTTCECGREAYLCAVAIGQKEHGDIDDPLA